MSLVRRLLIVAGLAILVSLGSISAGPPPQADDGLQRAIAVASENSALLDSAGIEGIGVGTSAEGAPVIRIFTATKGVGGIPSKLSGFDVETVVTGRIDAFVDPKARFDRPVPTGVSTGHPDITAGTIGARVKDSQGNVYALSNNHVYADVNAATLGDNVLQPGPSDGGQDPTDAIGTLADFESIKFGKKQTNTIDAAIALSTTALLGNATPSDGYGIAGSTTVAASVGLGVQKYGRTTGQAHGSVNEVALVVDVCYVPAGLIGCKKSARFVDQITVVDLIPDAPGLDDAFSLPGDSGSLIVTDDANANPVGLLFAGGSTRTIANRIDPVLARFNVTIDSGPPPPPNDAPIVAINSPADGATFSSGTTISFAGTATDTEDSDLTASLTWTSDIDGSIGTLGSFSTTLSDGNHTITASVTDSGGKTGTASVSITVGNPPPEPTTVGVVAVLFTTEGGKLGDKHLNVTYTVQDDFGTPVSGAVLSNTLTNNDTGQNWSGSATTGSGGQVTFTLKNAPDGCYTVTINGVNASGLTWDGLTPPHNPFCK